MSVIKTNWQQASTLSGHYVLLSPLWSPWVVATHTNWKENSIFQLCATFTPAPQASQHLWAEICKNHAILLVGNRVAIIAWTEVRLEKNSVPKQIKMIHWHKPSPIATDFYQSSRKNHSSALCETTTHPLHVLQGRALASTLVGFVRLLTQSRRCFCHFLDVLNISELFTPVKIIIRMVNHRIKLAPHQV